MPTWLPTFPKHKPFKCAAYWHLRKSGLWLATYELIGSVTRGGETQFFGSIKSVSSYFGTSYEVQRRVFTGMRRHGWLNLLTEQPGRPTFQYVPHDVWVNSHPDSCSKREVLPWQIETDPLVGRLYALSDGKLRVYESRIVALRKVATDEEIAQFFRIEMESAKAKRTRGEWSGTSPISCLARVSYFLKQRYEKQRSAELINH